MAKFDDLINSIGVGEDGVSIAYPDTFIDDLRGAYTDDMSIPDAQIQVLTAENAGLKQEVILLKAHNYELITQVPSEDVGSDNDSDNDSDDDSDEDVTTDDLFGDDDDDTDK